MIYRARPFPLGFVPIWLFSEVLEYLAAIATIPGIKNVEVFGSLAREGRGHDVDIIIVTDEERWNTFKTEVNKNLKETPGLGALVRSEVAYALFGETLLEAEIKMDAPLDIFVYPENWRDRLDELQRSFPHEDPQFMRNIARDAKDLSEVKDWSEIVAHLS